MQISKELTELEICKVWESCDHFDVSASIGERLVKNTHHYPHSLKNLQDI